MNVNGTGFTTLGSALVANKSSTVPEFSSGDPLAIDYYYVADGTTYNAGDTIEYRISSLAAGGDVVIGDFAILGCCVVPEPSTVATLFLGLGLLARRRRD